MNPILGCLIILGSVVGAVVIGLMAAHIINAMNQKSPHIQVNTTDINIGTSIGVRMPGGLVTPFRLQQVQFDSTETGMRLSLDLVHAR